MSNVKKPPLNRVVNTISLTICLSAILFTCFTFAEPYAGGSSSYSTGGVGIFIHGTNLGSSNGGLMSSAIGDIKCPRVCSCSGTTVDCSHRGLQQVPRRIPLDTERL